MRSPSPQRRFGGCEAVMLTNRSTLSFDYSDSTLDVLSNMEPGLLETIFVVTGAPGAS